MTYEQSAPVYDAIYTAMKDYPAEAMTILQRWAEFGPLHSDQGSVLDVACGTGLHLEAIRTYGQPDITGIDLSEAQLGIARQRLGDGVRLERADMTDFVLGRRFDLVTCLFSAIGHVFPFNRMQQAIFCMAGHLNVGGVLMVEPWLDPESFIPNRISMNIVDTPELKVARMGQIVRKGNHTQLTLKHIVGRPGEPLADFTEVHETEMYSAAAFRQAFDAAGLLFHHDPVGLMGRGLYIGVKPGPRFVR